MYEINDWRNKFKIKDIKLLFINEIMMYIIDYIYWKLTKPNLMQVNNY